MALLMFDSVFNMILNLLPVACAKCLSEVVVELIAWHNSVLYLFLFDLYNLRLLLLHGNIV